MSTPPNRPARPSANPPAASAPPPASESPWSQALSSVQTNKNLFIILGVAGAVLFLFLTFALIYALTSGGKSSTASPSGPLFPDQPGAKSGANVPPNPGTLALKPREAVNGFLYDLHRDDVGAAYSRTSEGFQRSTTLTQFRDLIYLKPGLRRYQDYSFKAISNESASRIHYEGRVWGGIYGTVDFTIEVVQGNNGWFVEGFSPD